MRQFRRKPKLSQRPQAIHEPVPAPAVAMDVVIETILLEFDDYVAECLRTQTKVHCHGAYADFGSSSPYDLADRGVTIYFNKVLPGLKELDLAAKLADELHGRGKRPTANFLKTGTELHIPDAF